LLPVLRERNPATVERLLGQGGGLHATTFRTGATIGEGRGNPSIVPLFDFAMLTFLRHSAIRVGDLHLDRREGTGGSMLHEHEARNHTRPGGASSKGNSGCLLPEDRGFPFSPDSLEPHQK